MATKNVSKEKREELRLKIEKIKMALLDHLN